MKDEFECDALRWVGAGLLPAAAFAMLTTDAPQALQIAYVGTVMLTCYTIAIRWRVRPYLYAFLGLLTLTGYTTAVVAYRQAIALFGKAATASFVWSVAALLIAFLISAHKASWLPPRLLPRWRNGGNGNEPSPAASAEASEPTS
ncbi:MAG: hypothetical protein U0992_22500 [Planctomycetaceae bacterium]